MIGSQLKNLRKQRNLTQEQMGSLLHMEQSTYNKYEKNNKMPNVALLKTISEEFNVSVDELLNTANINVNFESGSVNNGNGIVEVLDNFYAVPKDILDAILQQQLDTNKLLLKVAEKL